MKNLWLVFLLLPLQMLFAQGEAFDINTDDDYTHKLTKTIFPKLWNGYVRAQLKSYDKHQTNVGASYVKQVSKNSRNTITVYVYPNDADNLDFRNEFLSFQEIIYKNSNGAAEVKPAFGKISDEEVTVNFISTIFKNSVAKPDFFKGVKYIEKNSYLATYECGDMNFKIRISSDEMPDSEMIEMAKRAENYFQPLEIAKIRQLPIENDPDIIISQTAQRDSLMMHATMEAALAKIHWLKKNISEKERKTGFSPMNIDAEVFEIEEMLKYYNGNREKWECTDETKKYFGELSRIVSGNMTKDFLYYKYDGVIDYPEGESRKEFFTDFRIKQDINEPTRELMYVLFYKTE